MKVDTLFFIGCQDEEAKNIIKTSLKTIDFKKYCTYNLPLIIPYLFKNADRADNINMAINLHELDIKKFFTQKIGRDFSAALLLPTVYVIYYSERKVIN